ncbi:MAG TPA: hypothetical protein VNU68_15145, partial [Verrucomicrobiae bacterium]|nr:hypothetical protein [Verrucomicrobiae bacterium]
MISTLKEIGFWRRLFQWKAVCSEIGAEFASIKADLDTANLQLHAYEQRLSASKAELDQHKSHLHEANSELAHHRVKERRTREGHRTLLHFISQAHGLKVKVVVAFGILFACCSWGAFPPPFVHNPLDTNTLGLAPSTSYFLGWNGTKPAWGVPPDGLGTNSWLTNTSFIFPIPHLAASNDLGWWNSGGDVSFNATNNDKLFGLN